MKYIFTIFTLIIQTAAISQKDILEFYPLETVGNVLSADINNIIKSDNLGNKNYFFTESYKEEYGLFLLKKENENWTVYSFELYLNAGRNSIISKIKKENNRFVSVQIISPFSGVCESHYGKIMIIDIKKNKFIEFYNFAENQCYDENGVASPIYKCSAKFSIKGNFLKIKNSKKENKLLTDCIESGIYQYRNGKFMKIE